jgi:hypothetical protein
MPIENKLFLGFCQNKELLALLKQSDKWREAREIGESELKSVSYQENEYLGILIPSYINLQELKIKEKEVKSCLMFYIPQIILSKHPVIIFPKIFIF